MFSSFHKRIVSNVETYFRWRRAGKGLRNDVLCISLNMNEDYVAQIDAFSRDLVLKFPRALGCLSSVAITEMIRLLLLFCSWQLAESSDNCACTGIGLGANQRGFPDSYGESCAAWDDGDCTRHDCGPLKECAEMWPESGTGLWCCRPWCYVSELCALPDVSTSTQKPGFLYSYTACEPTVVFGLTISTATKYDDETCPYENNITFEVAFSTIFIAERMGSLSGHTGPVNSFASTTLAGAELLVSGGDDGLICVAEMQNYGGTLSVCTLPMRGAIRQSGAADRTTGLAVSERLGSAGKLG